MADALVVFKPDSAHRAAVRAALWSWLSQERAWKLESLTWFQPPTALIESHYDFLAGRPFFPWLVDFMSAVPVLVGRVTADASALEAMRYELGETRIVEARPGSLRERFGIYGGCNCMHLSDSVESGAKETALWAAHVALDVVDVHLDTTTTRPDHTYHLRSLAGQINAGKHTELAQQEVERLLAEETEAEGTRFQDLTRIILGAFS